MASVLLGFATNTCGEAKWRGEEGVRSDVEGDGKIAEVTLKRVVVHNVYNIHNVMYIATTDCLCTYQL